MTEPTHRTSTAGPPHSAGYDRPSGNPHQSRSELLARHGAIATSHPLAAQAGLDVMKNGGNAIDAAIAANAMLGVVEPMSCGIGGDLFCIYWDNKTKKLYGLNASGRSPKAINRHILADKQLKQIPLDGPLSWSVPGCVRGWQDLSKRFGSKPLADLLAPAIETARDGFPVTELIAGQWQEAESVLRKSPGAASTFLVGGQRAPVHGEVFRNSTLAATYQLLAKSGAKAFYDGPIADKMVEFSQQQGGYFQTNDFREHRSEWVEPVSTTYRGYRVWELPPNGQGIAALQMLNVLENFELNSQHPLNAEYLHLLVEAKKLAFADRAIYYADPTFGKLPIRALISKDYGKRQANRIDANKAATEVPAGDPQLTQGDTVYVTAVDRERNCCSLIQSIYYGFGSKMVPADLGFALQNRGALFSLDENHRNRLEPAKRPFHTIIPAMVTKDDRPWFCFGVMGGDMQPQGHVQILVNLIDFGMNIQAAGDAARVRHSGSATPTGIPADGVGTILVESGISDKTAEKLRQKGHQVQRAKGSFGGYQGILIDWDRGVLRAATESRKDGAAVGY